MHIIHLDQDNFWQRLHLSLEGYKPTWNEGPYHAADNWLAVNHHRLKAVASGYGSKPDRSALRRTGSSSKRATIDTVKRCPWRCRSLLQQCPSRRHECVSLPMPAKDVGFTDPLSRTLKSRPVLCPTVESEPCGLGGDHPKCCEGANGLDQPASRGHSHWSVCKRGILAVSVGFGGMSGFPVSPDECA